MAKNTVRTSLIANNKVGEISSADELQLNDYLAVARSFARLTYESVYIIDYARMRFEYVSENPLFLCGYTATEVMEMGYDFYGKIVPETDLAMLALLNTAGLDFFEKIPDAQKDQYVISYDFHVINERGEPVLINHRLTPLFITGTGRLWKAMCIVSFSHRRQAGNITIYKQGSTDIWKLNTATAAWYRSEKPRLTERETTVLRLYAQGLTIAQIAARLFVSPDTVKYYRRRIFESLEVGSIVEALSYAVHYKII